VFTLGSSFLGFMGPPNQLGEGFESAPSRQGAYRHAASMHSTSDY
jgi:hypothetical protein